MKDWNEELHPRIPAGSGDESGQFASKGANLIKKLDDYLDKFPDNAKTWSLATDEIRDMARMVKEYYNDQIDSIYSSNKLYKKEKEMKALNFNAITSPSKWNRDGKEYIKKGFVKLDQRNRVFLLRHFGVI